MIERWGLRHVYLGILFQLHQQTFLIQIFTKVTLSSRSIMRRQDITSSIELTTTHELELLMPGRVIDYRKYLSIYDYLLSRA